MTGLVPGRIVLYYLSAQDCREISRRRTTGAAIAERIASGQWPVGAQAHIGSDVTEGDTLPAQIVKVIDKDKGCANLKVSLDGSDFFWAPERYYTADKVAGTWTWPPRE